MFPNYEEEGPGVPKDAPPLPPVKRFFVIFGRKFIKLLWLNTLFLVTCLPLVTVGASLCALTRVCRKFSREEPCFVFSEYFDAFKANFFRALIPGVVCVVWGGVLTAELLYMFTVPLVREQLIMFIPALMLSVIFFIMQFYFWQMLDCLDLPARAVYKNALFLTVLGIFRNIPLFLAVVVVVVFMCTVPIGVLLIIFMPFSQMCYLITFICFPVIERFVIREQNPEKLEEGTEDE